MREKHRQREEGKQGTSCVEEIKEGSQVMRDEGGIKGGREEALKKDVINGSTEQGTGGEIRLSW